MDLSEVTGEVLNRHPWELSRTKCILQAFSVYLDRMHEKRKRKSYINIGAGDLYFDSALLKKYTEDQVHAVDIGYQDRNSEDRRIHKYHYLEEIAGKNFDYAIMMDSLEYMEDDVQYIRSVTEKLRKGGYMFFTLPACPGLFSDHDVHVGNLRRYSSRTFGEVLRRVPELKKVEEYNFYTSLFLVRFLQKALRLPIDPEHKVTAKWQYGEKSMPTRLLTGCLNLDFAVNRLLSRAGIRIPGLSMLVICRKIRDTK